MSLPKAIAVLHDAIGREGLNEGTVRTRLMALKSQAIALERRLKRSESNLKKCRTEVKRALSDLERLKADAETERLPSEEDSIDEIGKQILRLLAQSNPPSLEEMAKNLSLEWVVAKDHANDLVDEDMIELIAVTRRGSMYILKPKGEKSVAKWVRRDHEGK